MTCEYPTQPQPSTLLDDSVETQILSILASTDDVDPDLIGHAPLARMHALESLHHFVDCEEAWLKTPKIQLIMQGEAVDLVLRQPYLLHAVLAVSAAHLGVLRSEGPNYQEISLVHWQRSLRLYTARLDDAVESMDVDALYFTSHLHSILAFVHAKPSDIDDPWHLPSWLVSFRGVHVLHQLSEIAEKLQQGRWQEVYQSCEIWHQVKRERAAAASEQAISRATLALSAYCQSLEDAGDAALYEERMSVLMYMEKFAPSTKAISALSSYMGKAPQEYIARLEQQDPLALVLLLYWYQLFLRAEQWWLADCITQASGLLMTHLLNTGSEEIREIVRLMYD